MMGERTAMQAGLFYEFSLEQHVPSDHLLRAIDRFVDLSGIRAHLRPFYSGLGRPSIDPELLIRMLIIGYCMGIRSERRLCEEVHLNLAYRWFCRLGLEGSVPDHSTFSKNRHGRFRDSDLLRQVFETTVARCMAEGLVGGEGFAVDASMIKADANRQRPSPGAEDLSSPTASRAVHEYLAVLDDAAFGAATTVPPKFISPADPASRWTAANGGLSFFAYCTNYLIDLKHAVIMDVEATTAVRQAEVTAQRDRYTCPTGKELKQYHRTYATARPGVDKDGFMRYRASKHDCDRCALKPRCCPGQPARKIPRSIHEGARDLARDLALTEPIPPHVASGRRWRCCSPTSNASSNSIGSDYAGRMAPVMSSTSQPPPRI